MESNVFTLATLFLSNALSPSSEGRSSPELGYNQCSLFALAPSRQIVRPINSAEAYPIQTIRQRLGEELVDFAGDPVRAAKEAPPLQNHQPPIGRDVILINVAVFSECCVMYEARLILRIESGELPAASLFERPLKIAHRIPSIPWDLSLIHISEPTRRTPISYA